MDDPDREIEHVVRHLTQGTPDQQRNTFNAVFEEDASFVHPFVWVPRFSVVLPVLGTVNSRMAIIQIFRWYRYLSPQIMLNINSQVFDPTRNIVYVDITQRFAIWFIPFYAANVRLVTCLYLTPYQAGTTADPKTRYKISRQEDLYQINEWLKFVIPGLGAPVWAAWQLISTAMCIFLALASATLAHVFSNGLLRSIATAI